MTVLPLSLEGSLELKLRIKIGFDTNREIIVLNFILYGIDYLIYYGYLLQPDTIWSG